MNHLAVDPESVRGFLAADEGAALYAQADHCAPLGPCLEVGSYCGRSTVWLGSACAQHGGVLFAVDHHRGSEEHQPGEEYHEVDLADQVDGGINTFPEFSRNMRRAKLADTVVPIVAPSSVAARYWSTPLALVFIDGGHSDAAALTDYRSWAPHLIAGGRLLIHDIFEDPADGGQAPVTIMRLALASGLFQEVERVRTLAVLERIGV